MATAIYERRVEVGLMKALGAGNLAVSAIFFAEALLLALIGGVAGFTAGALLARQIGRSIFNSQISIEPVLFPIIMAIAVFVTFAGSAAAIRRAVKFDPVFALRGEGYRSGCTPLPSDAPHAYSEVAARRAHAPHASMFVRMLLRAAMLRRGRAASALLAMIVAAAVATAMMNLYVDVQAKLRSEFRNYGANVVIVAKDKTGTIAARRCDRQRSNPYWARRRWPFLSPTPWPAQKTDNRSWSSAPILPAPAN